MKTQKKNISIPISKTDTIHRIHRLPSMAGVFTKALFLSAFKSNTLKPDQIVERHTFVFRQPDHDPSLIKKYSAVCGFEDQSEDHLPAPYLQTLFINLLGRYIVSDFFPFNPLGLIQVYQSFQWYRPVGIKEKLDISCGLSGITRTDAGFLSEFLLVIRIGDEVVWQGTSGNLSRTPGKKKKREKKQDIHLDIKETIEVKSDTGRKYANVSGDYNPHHLYPVLARIFGFKSAIAHGMWSLARSISGLEKVYDIRHQGKVEAWFKLPVFMPARVTLGFEQKKDDSGQMNPVDFEIRDADQGLPHLKGQLVLNP